MWREYFASTETCIEWQGTTKAMHIKIQSKNVISFQVLSKTIWVNDVAFLNARIG